jgi:hypothetical protein
MVFQHQSDYKEVEVMVFLHQSELQVMIERGGWGNDIIASSTLRGG